MESETYNNNIFILNVPTTQEMFGIGKPEILQFTSSVSPSTRLMPLGNLANGFTERNILKLHYYQQKKIIQCTKGQSCPTQN